MLALKPAKSVKDTIFYGVGGKYIYIEREREREREGKRKKYKWG